MKIKLLFLISIAFAGCTNHKGIIVEQIRAKQREAAAAHMCFEFATSQVKIHFKDSEQVDLDIAEGDKQALIEMEANRAIDSLNLELKKY